MPPAGVVTFLDTPAPVRVCDRGSSRELTRPSMNEDLSAWE
jgi:hypothetical protein